MYVGIERFFSVASVLCVEKRQENKARLLFHVCSPLLPLLHELVLVLEPFPLHDLPVAPCKPIKPSLDPESAALATISDIQFEEVRPLLNLLYQRVFE